jgi:hypothetical protein
MIIYHRIETLRVFPVNLRHVGQASLACQGVSLSRKPLGSSSCRIETQSTRGQELFQSLLALNFRAGLR